MKKIIKKVMLCVFVVIILLVLVNHTKIADTILQSRITHDLNSRYHTKFTCDYLSLYGGGADFVCHPNNNPKLLFDGFADSETGAVIYDTYPGSIITSEDTNFLNEILSKTDLDAFAFGVPMHRGDFIVEEMISHDEYTLDDLHYKVYSPELLFYVFIYSSDVSYVIDPGKEYELLCQSADELTGMYKNIYNQEVSVTMHIYFVNYEKLDYVKEYFSTHLYPDMEFISILKPRGIIYLQLGSEQGNYSETMRLTRDEYIEEREMMGQI